MHKYICFDVGGTCTKYALLDKKGEIIVQDKITTINDKDVFLENINKIILTFLEDNLIDGLCFSMPGFIDVNNGIALKAGAITALDGFAFTDYFEEKFSIPTSIENDANCIALAEKWLGKAQKLNDFICISIGTGIGGALFLNNKLYRGHRYTAGEFGYMIVGGTSNNLPGNCMLSSQASIYSLRRIYARYYNKSLKSVTGEEVFASNHPFIIKSINDFYYNIALLIVNLSYSYSPEMILIGGGITKRNDFIKNINYSLKMLYCDDNFDINIDTCLFYNDAGLVGALAFHLESSSILGKSKF